MMNPREHRLLKRQPSVCPHVWLRLCVILLQGARGKKMCGREMGRHHFKMSSPKTQNTKHNQTKTILKIGLSTSFAYRLYGWCPYYLVHLKQRNLCIVFFVTLCFTSVFGLRGMWMGYKPGWLLIYLCKLVYLIWFVDVYILVPFRVEQRRTISPATPHIRSLHMEGKPCLHVLRYPQQMLAAQGSLSKATSGHGRQRCNMWLWCVLGSLLFVYQSSPCEHSGKSF